MDIHDFLRLEPIHSSVRQTGPDRWQCLCPAHPDCATRSLCISVGGDRRILLKCQAGCPTPAVCDALGIPMSELFNGPPVAVRAGFHSGPIRAVPARQAPQIVATYDYRDEEGRLLFQSIRLEPKEFRQRRPEGDAWTWNLAGVRRVLYRLPELLAADPGTWVFVPEGEKDCDNLAALGLTATCNPMGAGKWDDDYNEFFRGRNVCLLPDHDRAGARHALDVLGALKPVAARLVVLQLPDLPPKGDVSDWLDARDGLEPGALAQRLLSMAEEQARDAARLAAIRPSPKASDGHDEPVLLCLSEVQSKSVDWLWPGRIPLGMLTLLASDPGLGKTWTALDLIARVTRGLPWPDQGPDAEPSPVASAVILTSEDALSYTIRPRLERLGGDPSRVFVLKGASTRQGRFRVLNVGEDLPILETVLEEIEDVRIVVFDPITAYLGETDSHKNAEVRAVLSGLSDLAERRHVAVVAISHMNKKSDLRAIYRIMGSMGFTAAARAVWTIASDKGDRDRRLLIPLKMNLCPEPTGMAFRIVDEALTWENEPLRITADEALADTNEDDRTALDEAAQWLVSVLADGRMRSTEILELADREGISEKTLKRAKARLRVESAKEGSHHEARWYWQLP